MVVIPIHYHYSDDVFQYIIENAQLDCVICTHEYLENVQKICKASSHTVKHFVSMKTPEKFKKTSKNAYNTFESLELIGSKNTTLDVIQNKPNSLFTVIYTSGSTGKTLN